MDKDIFKLQISIAFELFDILNSKYIIEIIIIIIVKLYKLHKFDNIAIVCFSTFL